MVELRVFGLRPKFELLAAINTGRPVGELAARPGSLEDSGVTN